MKKEKVNIIINELSNMYPDADTELVFNNNYELLVAVMLSAQCTDKRVNVVTKELFKEYNTPQKMITLSQEELEKKIFSCGFYHNKAKNILAASKILVQEYAGEVPCSLEKLRELPGVGRKTANVVAAVGFGIPAIAVDTHVFRVANRIGLTNAKNELNTELQLQKCIPREKWLFVHHLLIWHGRRCCASQRPKCDKCNISQYCKHAANTKKIKQSKT